MCSELRLLPIFNRMVQLLFQFKDLTTDDKLRKLLHQGSLKQGLHVQGFKLTEIDNEFITVKKIEI